MTGEEQGQVSRVRTTFVNSNLHRVIHADGIWGGISPHAGIRMAVYSEAAQDPESVLYDVSKSAPVEIGRVEASEVEEGVKQITRVIEADIIISLAVAESLHRWLGEKISELREGLSQLAREGASE